MENKPAESDSMPSANQNPMPSPPRPNEDLPDVHEDKQSDLDLPGGKGLVKPGIDQPS